MWWAPQDGRQRAAPPETHARAGDRAAGPLIVRQVANSHAERIALCPIELGRHLRVAFDLRETRAAHQDRTPPYNPNFLRET